MTRINDLFASSVTDTRSAFIWAVSSNSDYSVSVYSLGNFMKHRIGVMLVYSSTGQGVTSGTILGYTSAFYDPDGWFNSNSVGSLRAPNDKVTHARFRVGARFTGTDALQLGLYKNGAALNLGNLRVNENPNVTKSIRIEAFTGQVSISSGDRFEILSTFQSGTNTLQGHAFSSFTMIPERFKS